MSIDESGFRNLIGQGDSVNFDGYLQLLTHLSGSGSPVGSVTPRHVGDHYLDTAGAHYWKATGATSSDWKQTTV